MGPLEVIEKQFNDVYKRRKHQSKIRIVFTRNNIEVEDMETDGYCMYNEKSDEFLISVVLGEQPFELVCETYIHELCHVLVHPYQGHGKKFQKRLKMMAKRFGEYLSLQYQCGEIMSVCVSAKKSMTIKGK